MRYARFLLTACALAAATLAAPDGARADDDVDIICVVDEIDGEEVYNCDDAEVIRIQCSLGGFPETACDTVDQDDADGAAVDPRGMLGHWIILGETGATPPAVVPRRPIGDALEALRPMDDPGFDLPGFDLPALPRTRTSF